jgi:transcriptional regulator of NAD metabolism
MRFALFSVRELLVDHRVCGQIKKKILVPTF